MLTCADCGRSLVLRHGRWADIEGRPNEPNGWHFTCRDHRRVMPDGTLRVEAADYHYVVGEVQRHFPNP